MRGLLHAVELEIQLQSSPFECLAEARREICFLRQPHAVRIQQEVVDVLVVACPFQQLEELRMQRRLAAGQLENLNAALAVDDALHALLHLVQRHGVHLRGER